MSDLGADILAEWKVVLENVIWLSVFAFGRRAGFVVGVYWYPLRQVLSSAEERLCQMKLGPMKGHMENGKCLYKPSKFMS